MDFWDRFSAYYDSAEALPIGAFGFDSTDVSDEASAVVGVYAKYAMNLMSGSVDPATELPKFLDELTAAGIDTIVDAANAQLAAYLGK